MMTQSQENAEAVTTNEGTNVEAQPGGHNTTDDDEMRPQLQENAEPLTTNEGLNVAVTQSQEPIVQSQFYKQKKRVHETEERMRAQMQEGQMPYGFRKTTWNMREKTIHNLVHGKEKKRKKRERERWSGCSAGTSCCDQQHGMRWKTDHWGSSNASTCCTCGNASHDCCSYLWNNQVFCLECFKEQMRNCSNVESFEALLEQNKHQEGSRKVHMIGEQDIRKSVDEYLCNDAKLQMNLEQYLKWKKMEKRLSRKLQRIQTGRHGWKEQDYTN